MVDKLICNAVVCRDSCCILFLSFIQSLVCWSSQLVLTCFSHSQCNCSATGLENTTEDVLMFIQNKEISYEVKSELEL